MSSARAATTTRPITAHGTSLSRQQDLPPVLAQQPRLLCRFTQVQHRQGLALAISLADPLRRQVEFCHRGIDMDRREVTSTGQRDAIGADATQQPRIGTDHPGRGFGVGLHRLIQGSVADQVRTPRGIRRLPHPNRCRRLSVQPNAAWINVVEVVEEQVGRDLESTPQWRFGALEIDTDPIGDAIETARAPS